MSHPYYRKIFWNVRDAFFGQKFLIDAPKALLYFPVLVGAPLYGLSVFQTSEDYYLFNFLRLD